MLSTNVSHALQLGATEFLTNASQISTALHENRSQAAELLSRSHIADMLTVIDRNDWPNYASGCQMRDAFINGVIDSDRGKADSYKSLFPTSRTSYSTPFVVSNKRMETMHAL